MLESELTQRARYFHYATRLPVFWYREGKRMAALPQDAVTIGGLLGAEGAPLITVHLDDHTPGAAHELENAYGERYLCLLCEPDDLLLCGPYCMQTFGQADILRHIRDMRLPLAQRDAITAYYEGLTRFHEMNVYYTGILLERVVGEQSAALVAEPAAPSDELYSQRFYRNAYQNRMAMFQHPPYFFEQEIRRQIIACNRQHAMELLSELNSLTRAKLADTPLRSLKNSLIASVTFFTRAAIAGGVPSDEAFTLSDSFIQTVERQNDMRVLYGMERDMVCAFIDRVEANKAHRTSQLIRRVIDYVDEHLAEEMKTPQIAAAVFVHPDYLSKRFRQEMGESLHGYILRRRVEEAAHFMRYSQDSVNSIAALYQFSSQSHFISVFKRYMGVTPQRYRSEEAGDGAE